MSGIEQCCFAMDVGSVVSGPQSVWFQADDAASLWRAECIVFMDGRNTFCWLT
jgi:hypothetical protein